MRLGAGEVEGLVGDGGAEVALLEEPVEVGVDEGEVAGLDVEGDGLGLAGSEGDLVEGAETLDVGGERGDHVADVEEDRLGASYAAGVGDVDLEGELVGGLETGLVDTEVAIFISSIAETGAEGIEDVHDGVVVVVTLHGGHVFAGLVVVGGK